MPTVNKLTRDEFLNRLRLVVETSLGSTLSSREVAERVGVSHTIVCRVRKNALAAALDWNTVSPMPTQSIYELLVRAPGSRRRKKERPDFDYFSRRLEEPGMNKEWAYAEYKASTEHALGYSRFCQLLHEYRRPQKATMKQIYEPGYRLEIDFSGDRVSFINRKGKREHAELLLLVWPYSGMTYACCVPSQKIDDVIAAMVRALRFFDGVPRALVPDNFAAAVITPGTDTLRIQPDFLRFAEAHGMAVLPARPRSPTHKGAVESQVRRLQEYLLPELARTTYRSYEALDAAVEQLVVQYNDRPLSEKLLGTRREEFDAREKPAVQQLPETRYVHRHHIGRFKVAPKHYLRVLDNFYSVPHELVGQHVEAFVVDRVVEIMHEGDVVATHDRRWGKLEYVVNPEHQKASHRAQAGRDRKGIEAWAQTVGPTMTAYLRHLFAEGPVSEQALPGAQAVHSACQDHQPAYLEKVAAEAIRLNMTSPTDFKRLLRMLRNQGLSDPARPRLLPRHGFPASDRLLPSAPRG